MQRETPGITRQEQSSTHDYLPLLFTTYCREDTKWAMCFISAALSLILLPVIPGYIAILSQICITLYARWLNSAALHSAYYLVERVRAKWDEGWRTQILRGFAKPDIVILQPSAPLQLGSDCSGNSVRCIIVHCPLQLLQLLLIQSVLAAMYSSNCSNCH